MKIYCMYDGEQCEVFQYNKAQSMVILISPTEGSIRVEKRLITLIGFKNGKGDTGETHILHEPKELSIIPVGTLVRVKGDETEQLRKILSFTPNGILTYYKVEGYGYPLVRRDFAYIQESDHG